MKALTLFGILFLIVCCSSAFGQEEDAEAVLEDVLAKVQECIDAPSKFQPVSDYLIERRRGWLLRTIDRLLEYMDENPDLPEVQLWRQKLEVTAVRQEILKQSPDTHILRQIRDEDEYERVKEEIASGNRDNFLNNQQNLGYHVVLSFMQATDRFVEVADDFQHHEEGQGRLKDRLTELQSLLTKYRDGPADRRQTLKAIHAVVGELETSKQVGELAQYVQERYLHPKIRVFVSANLLTYLLSGFPLDSQSVAQCQNGTYVQGVGTPVGRLRIVGIESDGIGILEGRYDDLVVFHGSAHRGPINLGISACLKANVGKRFFVIDGAPDSDPSGSRVRLLSASSSGGRLADRIVDSSARRSFNAANLSGRLQEEIDDTVTAAANYVNLGMLQELRKEMRKRHGDITRVRQYRSRPQGIELTILSARQGFQTPEPCPPDPFRDGADHDFSISFRRGLAQDLAGVVFPDQDAPMTIERIRERLAQGFELGGTSGDEGGESLKIWFSKDRPFVRYSGDNSISIDFLVASGEDAGTPGTLHIQPQEVDGGLDLGLELELADDELKQQLLGKLSGFSKLRRLQLPSLERLRDVDFAPPTKLRFRLKIDPSYLTAEGQLDLP